MHDIVVNWNIVRKDWKGLIAAKHDDNAMQIGAMTGYGGHYQPKGFGKWDSYQQQQGSLTYYYTLLCKIERFNFLESQLLASGSRVYNAPFKS